MKLVVCLLVLFVVSAWAEQKCTMHNGVRMYRGKKCASTTRYNDGHTGACGCRHNDSPFLWNNDHYVAAAIQKLFSSSNGVSRCGDSCRKCVKLTTTGGVFSGNGRATKGGQSEVFMITNECPREGPGPEWCGLPASAQGNTHGYEVHFDLENQGGQISRLNWDNPEVTWEWSRCPGSNIPTMSMYHTCECSR